MTWLSGPERTQSKPRDLLAEFTTDKTAAMSVEYALIAVVLCGCLFVALPLISTEIAATFTAVAGYFATILSS